MTKFNNIFKVLPFPFETIVQKIEVWTGAVLHRIKHSALSLVHKSYSASRWIVYNTWSCVIISFWLQFLGSKHTAEFSRCMGMVSTYFFIYLPNVPRTHKQQGETSAQAITLQWNWEANDTVLTEHNGKSCINSNESRKHICVLALLLQNALFFFFKTLCKVPSNMIVFNAVMQISN